MRAGDLPGERLGVILRAERCLMLVTQNRAAIATIAGGDMAI
jgi:alanine-alpha-ketoisovalerate/valine-pyruvate aminotransferase